jgi:ABC-type dipeptide/oligopeptide/nickel transport system permease subunit
LALGLCAAADHFPLEVKMNRTEWFDEKFTYLKRFFLAAILGSILAYLGNMKEISSITALGVILIIPFFLWLVLIPVFHWKDRYVGKSSGVWGFFLVFETTSWLKVIYWFKHVIPDWRKSGRYQNID